MFPLFPFVAGVLTGAVALRLIKTDKTKAGLDKAQDKLRDARCPAWKPSSTPLRAPASA